MERLLETEDALPALADELLKSFSEQRVFIFQGDLGAGKTTIIKEICKKLGATDVMSSPSFGIINEYFTSTGNSIFHVDCYRLEEEVEAYDIGLVEILDSGDYCFIEWPEKIHNLLPDNYVRVSIQVREKQRKYNISLE